MTKAEIDKYFIDNWVEIQSVVKSNSSKCATANTIDISTDIYLVCIEKAAKINNLSGFIRILASNIYRWERSEFNQENRVFANASIDIDIYEESEVSIQDVSKKNRLLVISGHQIEHNEDSDINDEVHQRRMFAIEAYKLHAQPHEMRILEMYGSDEPPTVRGLIKNIGVSHHGAYTIIKDFKHKIKQYERKAQID